MTYDKTIIAIAREWAFDIDAVDWRKAFTPCVFFANCVDTLANWGSSSASPIISILTIFSSYSSSTTVAS
jgi:hypothetical protein